MGKRVDKDPIPVGQPGWERDRSDRAVTIIEGPSLTEQAHKDECDINVLMARYEKVGAVPRGADGQMFYGDFTNIGDFQSAQNAVIEAEHSFMQLPAKIRSRFDNDPQKLLQALADPSMRDDLTRLGVLDPKVPGPVVNPIPDVTPAAPASLTTP